MPSFGFYIAGGGIYSFGRMGLLLAWNPKDLKPDAVDGFDISNIFLYSWVGALSSIDPQAFKAKSEAPIGIPANGCPVALDDPAHDYIVRFGIKSGGTGGSSVVDGWLDVFEGNARVYGAMPTGETLKIDLADGSAGTMSELSMQDRLTLQALENPPEGDIWATILGRGVDSKDIWRELMTPGLPLVWW